MNMVYAKQAVWIDSDPACGHAKTDDVDDCWALLLALRSNELDIRGISTLFGNGSGEKSYRTAIELIQRFGNEGVTPAIHRGAGGPLDLRDKKQMWLAAPWRKPWQMSRSPSSHWDRLPILPLSYSTTRNISRILSR